MNNQRGGVPDLAARGQVAVTDMRLIAVAGVDLKPGGLVDPTAVCHLQVVDVVNGTAWLIPLAQRNLRALHDMAAQLLETEGHA